MDRQHDHQAARRRTVSYTLPHRLIDAVALHAIKGRFLSKSHAVQDLIERGLRDADRTEDLLPHELEDLEASA